ncbi:MAG: hypothetical protein WCV67_19615 [Victivallaceae bacterium]
MNKARNKSKMNNMSSAFAKRFFIILVFALVSALHGEDNASITVDPQKVIGTVNQMVFGNNVSCLQLPYEWSHSRNTGNGVWNPVTHSARADFLALFKEMGVKSARYPSGSDANTYKWTEFVGPKETRPKRLFGLNEWLSWCRELNAVPVFTVNENATPEEAADLVDYLNGPADANHPWALKRAAWGHPEPYNVTWFELGNECYFNKKRFPDGAAYADWAAKIDRAMKARDPGIRLGLVVKFNWGRDAAEWNESVFKRAKFGDFAIHHTYPNAFDGNKYEDQESAMGALLMGSEQWAALYRKINADIRQWSGRDLPIAVTEFQGYWPEGKNKDFNYYLYSWGNAFFCGDLTREMLMPSNHVNMAHYFQATGIQLKPVADSAVRNGKETAWKRFPAFFVSRLWEQHTGTDILAAEVAAPLVKIKWFGIVKEAQCQAVTALASRREDGTICLMVFNRDMKNDIPVTIRVKGKSIERSKCWQVTSPSLVYANPDNTDMETISGAAVAGLKPDGFTVKLPKFSITAFEMGVSAAPETR